MLAAQSNKKLSELPVFSPPPRTLVEPVVEKLHGIEVVDPYRWLEDQNSTQTRQWLSEQAAYFRAYFDRIPGRAPIRKRLEDLLAVDTISEPWEVAGRCFFLKRTAHQEQPVIMLQECATGHEIALVNPADMGEHNVSAVSILDISPDGRILAYAIRRSGEDPLQVAFVDVDQKRILPDHLPRGFFRGLVLSRNLDGFFYVHEVIGAPRPNRRAAYWHEFGTASKQDAEVFFAGEDRGLRLQLLPSSEARLLGYLVTRVEDQRTFDFYIHDWLNREPPHRVVHGMKGRFIPAFVGTNLFALTDWRSPNGRIVRINTQQPGCNNWHEIVPRTDATVRDFAVAAGLILVLYEDNGTTRIEVFEPDGQRRGTLPCPAYCTARLLRGKSEGNCAFYSSSSFSQPSTILRYCAPTDKHDVWFKPSIPFDSSSIEVEHLQYPSKDGTLVPMFLACRKGLRQSGPLSTFLTGYGGFGAAITPHFSAHATLLIEHGFLYAVANVRGGSELGRAWHSAGKRHNRQRAIDDFIAAAEWLLAEGRSEVGKVAIGGGSNGGLLVGAALTQRPDLFRAALCLGPLLDMLRYHLFDSTNQWVEEYGSAECASDFSHLRAYSPLHNVRDFVPYPAVLLISGDSDTRCNPLHARKMAARLQAATSSSHPVLLDYRPAWGHSPVQPLSARIDALTDRLAFLCHELGVKV